MKTTLAFGTTLLAMAATTVLAVFGGVDLGVHASVPATIVGTAAPAAAATPPLAPAPELAGSARPLREVRLDTVVITGRAHRTARAPALESATGPTASRPYMAPVKAD